MPVRPQPPRGRTTTAGLPAEVVSDQTVGSTAATLRDQAASATDVIGEERGAQVCQVLRAVREQAQ